MAPEIKKPYDYNPPKPGHEEICHSCPAWSGLMESVGMQACRVDSFYPRLTYDDGKQQCDLLHNKRLKKNI